MLRTNEYYLGYSKNPDDRFRASSGGVGTALMRHLLSLPEYGTGITFVFDKEQCMYVPKLIFSEKDINVCGSVYQDIDLVKFVKDNIKNIKSGIVLSCAPCQIVPIRSLLKRSGINNFIISYACSGQTTIEGTWCYYKFLGVDKEDVVNMQYRGNGWPSGIQIWLKNGNVVKKDNWTEPWNSIHQSNLFKPKRCLFCKLDMGKQADINLADPWLEQYKKNEKVGATLCIVCSKYGKQVFESMVFSGEIDAIPSTYNDYATAELPNVYKEIVLQSELLYKRRISKLLNVGVYRRWASKNRKNLHCHLRLQNLIRILSKKRKNENMIFRIIEHIKNRMRFYHYRKRLGKCGSFSIGTKCVVNNPQCIYLGSNVSIGENSYFGPVVNYMGVAYNPKIIIGNGTWVGKNCSLAAINKVEIGENVLFAGNVHITDHSHGYEDISKPVHLQPLISKGPVVIEDDCWLGFGCEILSGVHIGKHSVVGARAVVTKDVPAYSIVAGNPARIVKKYDMEKKKWVRI